jgi:hypothetical protein
MNTVETLKMAVNQAIEQRDYFKLYNLINNATQSYISMGITDPLISSALINLNTDALEYLGASKQFESAFELHSQLLRNRVAIFELHLTNQPELLQSFKRMHGLLS